MWSIVELLQEIRPIRNGFAVTPNDDADLVHETRQLSIGNGGDVRVKLKSGDVVTYKKSDDSIISAAVVRVYATGTSATNIVGEY